MKFVQFSKLQFDYLFGCIFAGVVCLFCLCIIVPAAAVWDAVLITAATALTCAGSAWAWYGESKKVVCIDENGISLTNKGKPEWAFAWEEIQRIGHCSPYRHRGIFFVPKDPPKQDLWTVCAPYRYEFHLNKTAKEALERYCRLPIEK